MKFKIMLLIVLLLGFVSIGLTQEKAKTDGKMMKPNSDEQMLINMEKTAWKNLVDKKYDDFAKMFADDYQGVYSEMVTNKTSEVEEVKKMTFKSADVADTKVTFPTKDTAIVTSMVKMNVVNAEGQEMTGNTRTTTVLVKRGKDWMVVYHTNIPAKM